MERFTSKMTFLPVPWNKKEYDSKNTIENVRSTKTIPKKSKIYRSKQQIEPVFFQDSQRSTPPILCPGNAGP